MVEDNMLLDVERVVDFDREERADATYLARIAQWNDTACALPRQTLPALFEQQVAAAGESVALVEGTLRLSYRELNARANRLAHHLRAAGVGAESRIGVCMERSHQAVVAMLAIAKAGGAYVPLDPSYPPERLAYLCADAAVALVLTERRWSSALAAIDVALSCVDELSADVPETNVQGPADAEQLLYVMYTSGSTGQPKGVMVSHRNVVRLVRQTQYVRFHAGLTIGHVANIAFDASTFEIWGALLNGARLAVIGHFSVLAADAFARQLHEHGVTTLFLTTALFQACVRNHPHTFAGLDQVLFGGEICDPGCVAQALQEHAPRQILHVYGPTETTTFATSHVVETIDPTATLPIGRPLSNTTVHLLDANLRPVPPGMAAELYIGGDGVARGYAGRPDLTAASFIPDPFSTRPGARMYNSGDWARYRHDGSIEFLGRRDQQVKLRGFRIELGEIEAAMLAEPQVQSAAVLLQGEGELRQLVAYASAVAGATLTDMALLQSLAQRVPAHMVPWRVLVLNRMPLTANGKIDRAALPRAEAVAGGGALSTPLQIALGAIWCEILQLDAVGPGDDFFALGGTSLLAARLIARVRKELALDVPVRVLFDTPILADLADAAARCGDDVSPIHALSPSLRTGALPLSFAQQRLWFLCQTQGVSETYRVSLRLHLKGALDAAALRRALDRIVERHETLRTTFLQIDGEPRQVIASALVSRCELVEDVLAKVGDLEELAYLLALDADAPFDLERGPLIRGRLVRLAEEEHALLISMHHIVTDEWSMGLLASELDRLYAEFRQGQDDPLPALPVQYADYAVWQRDTIAGEIVQQQGEYWQRTLAGAPALLELPTDRPRPARQDYGGDVAVLVLDAALTRAINALGRRHGATPFMTLLSAWAVLLGRLSGQEDLVIGTPTANRGRSEIDDLIGFFVNTLAIRVDLTGSPTVGALIGRVKQQVLAAQHHQDIPLEQVVGLVCPSRDAGYSPLFQVGFTWQDGTVGQFRLAGLQVQEMADAPHLSAKFDQTLILREVGSTIVGQLEYATALFDRTTIERSLGQLRTLLTAMVAGDAQMVARLPLLDEAEQAQVLHGWNASEVAFPAPAGVGAGVHALFEARVAAAPDAVALVQDDLQASYAELNADANRLAHHLRSLGVGPDTCVAICAERGLRMVTAMLAVWKAGGAYVPLDPAYPAERLAYMLHDSAPLVVLTDCPAGLADAGLVNTGLAQAGVPPIDLTQPSWGACSTANLDAAAIGLRADHLAYLIYTSGSTGLPKGTMLAHRGVCNLAQSQIASFGLRPDSRVLQFASFSFDASVSEVLTALCSGATLCLPPAGQPQVGSVLAATIARHRITHCTLPPAVLATLDDDVTLAPLHTLVVAGEAVPAAVAQRWSRSLRLINAYGPTETTVCAAEYVCPADLAGPPPIGLPIANTRIYILDPLGQPVPPGVAGELYIQCPGVARGYRGRPDLTAERFVPDPFSGLPGARMYRSGDRGAWNAEGNIVYLGRADFQLKVRGFRIEPGEVEVHLAAHRGVREAVVVAREDEPGDRRLVAYVVPQQERPIELWPSVAEYFIYDDLLYFAMTNDERRNESYRVAIRRAVPGKVVVEVGTGKDAILARFCVAAGAARVYAIELLEATYLKAKECIEQLHLQDRIILIHGDATRVELPELADVCVSEIVGPIGGCEGASMLINNAWRFMKEDGVMIPERTVTRIAAVSLPAAFLAEPHFTEVGGQYVEKVFRHRGYSFDLRLCLRGMTRQHLASDIGTFEDLDHRGLTAPEYVRHEQLTINCGARIDGFLVWLNLYTAHDEVIDILDHEYCWLPVYCPVFHGGVDVLAGDRIELTITSTLCENGLNPDYRLQGRLVRQQGQALDFDYTAYHFKEVYRQTPFYRDLFDGDKPRIRPAAPGRPVGAELLAELASRLPAHMLPSAIVMLDALPLTANGKLDRAALPAPDGRSASRRQYEAPHAGIESAIAFVWRAVLHLERVGRHDNFFELGGNSLLVVRVVALIRKDLGIEVPVRALFEAHVLSRFTEMVVRIHDEQEAPQLPLGPVARDRVLPLSFAQQRLWFLDQLLPGSAFYNVPVALRLHGPLVMHALHSALERLVERHEVLRSRFPAPDGIPVQCIEAAGIPPLACLDLNDADEQTLQQAIDGEARRPFDLAQGPLLRCALLRRNHLEHVLILTLHHIVADGASIPVLWSDLAELYRAALDQRAAVLVALPVQYADYAVWQRAWLTDAAFQHQLGYWRQRLDGYAGVLELPTDRPRPALQSLHGAVASHRLDPALRSAVHALSLQQSVTPFMTLLATFKVLLARYTGQTDLGVGTPVANRTRVEVEHLIGFFANTLVLRTELGGNPRFDDLLDRVRDTALNAYAHADLPFDRLVEELQPERSMGHMPLYQIMFSVHDGAPRRSAFADLQADPLALELGAAKCDFTLTVQDDASEFVLYADYSTDLFEPATIARLLQHFETLLRTFVAKPATRIGDAGLAEPAELARIAQWNDTACALPRQTLPALFEQQVAAAGESVALVEGTLRLSYRELNARANRLAHHLRAAGVGAESRIGVCMERSHQAVVAMLAIAKAGGAYVPLDPSYPPERLAYLCADAAVALVLTERRWSSALAAIDVALSCVDELSADVPETNVQGPADAEQLLYVMYTSGSTGQPKGVMVSHRNVVRLVRQTQYVRFHAGLTIGHVANIAFDASTFEIWGALLNGARLAVIGHFSVLAADAFARQLHEHGVTTLFLTTALFQACVRNHPHTFAGLDQVLFGGEICDPGCVAQALQEHAPRQILHVYGPTETTTFATSHVVETIDPTATLPIGRPLSNTTVHLLDANLRPVPPGMAAELYIGGDGVARGYAGRPDLTAASFIPDPFSTRPGARMYNSGDWARYRHDGSIEFLGRRDQQVKLRGFRIELGEIEAAMLAEPQVQSAAVLLQGEGELRQLVAYASAVAGATLTDMALLQSLAQRLPAHMVPWRVLVLNRMPLTANGKIDRAALPRAEAVAGGGALSTPLQIALGAIWCEILQLDAVGPGDDFFALGGTSLLAARLIARVRKELALDVPVRVLFDTPILADLADAIGQLVSAASARLRNVLPALRDGALPLSLTQQGVWILSQTQTVSDIYHISVGLHLRGPLDAAALRRALDRIVERHENLRTTFAQVDGEPCQVIAPAQAGLFPLLEESADADRLAYLLALDADAPFDLERGPLIRGRLVRLAEEEHALLISMHHIVTDEWSMGLLASELDRLYAEFRQGQDDPLPALPVQYADYAVWQRDTIAGEIVQQQGEYWQRTLAGAPALLELPTDRPRPARQDYGGDVAVLVLDAALTRAINALGRRHGATPFMTLLSAWAVLLGRLSGQEDLVIGTPTANRGRSEIDDLIGFFVNTLAIRVDLTGSPTVGALIGRVKQQVLAAQHHQDIPLEQVVGLVCPSRDAGYSPLFQVGFTWQDGTVGQFRLAGLQVQEMADAPHLSAKFDQTLILREVGSTIVGQLEYATALFDRTTIERSLGQLRTLLTAMVAGDAQMVARLPLLDEAEQAQVLHGWNASEVAFPAPAGVGAGVHALFEARVAAAPDAVALVQDDLQASYAELNADANRLAHHLRSLGVGPDTCVAICAERGLRMVTAMLAVWKAGGAYVPLDPAYPAERLAYMLHDSAPLVVLTDCPAGLADAGLVNTGLAQAGVPPIDLTQPSWGACSTANLDAAAIGLRADHLAYLIYTSGSTGLPKGTMLAHRGVCNLAQSQIASFGLRPDSRVLQFASFSFDASVSEVLTALCSGATLCLPPAGQPQVGSVLAATIARHRITHCTLPPAVLATLDDDVTLAPLHTLVVAGEAVPAAVAQRWSRSLRLINAYGPTETTVCAAEYVCPADLAGPPPIGLPIANTRIYILDPLGQPVPPGVAGELYIQCPGVARGYRGRPDLTAERFVPDPFSGLPGARMYRSGDRGAWNAEGNIVYLGRADFQLKVRGFRIEPGEVEVHLAAHRGVREAVVVAREDEPGDRRLVAYVVPQQERPIELWPSVAEYFIYDDLLYFAMTNDERRNESYRVAIRRAVPGKVVVEVGTGKDAILARFCVAAGAARVYAIELLEATYLKAKECIEQLHLQDRIILIHGDATRVELPELADVCVSEIVGPIGGCEGASMLINNAWRFMKEDGVMIPERTVTRIAAVSLPAAFLAEPHFTEVGGQYVEKVFRHRGYSFDLRLCLRGMTRQHLASDIGTFEDLDHRGLTAPEYVRHEQLTINCGARIDGFLVWLNLYTAHDEVIDILDHEYCWLPVYCPVFHGGVDVLAGDRIELTITSTLCENGLNPDYRLQGRLVRQQGQALDFDYTAYHFKEVYRQTPFYRDLFDGDKPRIRPAAPGRPVGAELLAELASRLPAHMLPSAIVMLDALPLTANGKLDRAALPAPDGRSASRRQYEAPHAGIESAIAFVWRAVLHLERVGRHDNFFELGGNSLLVVRVVALIRKDLGIEVPVRALFEAHVLSRFTEMVVRIHDEQEAPQLPLGPVARDRVLPLSFAQQRLWFLDQLLPGSAFYNVPVALRLHGPLVMHALHSALERLVERHEVLRSRFPAPDGIPVQCIEAAGIPPLACLDLNDADEQTLQQAIDGEARRPFDLAQGPLLRCALLRRNHLEHVLILTLHHIVADGASIPVLWSDLAELYRAALDQRAAVLVALPVQYADYAVWQRAWLTDAAFQHQLGYWRQRLDGYAGVLELPTDRPRPALQSLHGAVASHRLDPALRSAVHALSLQQSVTPFMTLLATFKVLLARYTGQTDLGVGTPVANRTRVEVEHLIGFFANTLVLRTELGGNPRFDDLLDRVRDTALNAYAHADLPFDRLVEELQPERSMGHMPLYQIMFSVHDGAPRRSAFADLQADPLALELGAAKCDFTLTVQDDASEFVLYADYSTDLFEPATIARLLQHFETLLRTFVAKPATRIGDAGLAEPAELARIAQWNDTACALPRQTLPALFEQQVAAAGESVALVEGTLRLSYRELNARANRLAHHLRAAGVGAESRIGVCMERSHQAVVAMLAIAKAGGAYVPLDPSYPPERLAYLCADAAVALVLTERRWSSALAAIDVALSCVDELSADVPETNVQGPADAEQLLYVMYTSGSTGQPKGVMVSHRNVVRLVRQTQYVRFHAGLTIGHVANIAFDASTFEIWGALLNGARLAVIGHFSVLAADAFARQLHEHGVTTLFLTTALFQACVRNHPHTFAGLDQVLFGGEICDPGCVAQALQEHAPRQILHVYGPTETTTFATSHVVETIDPTATLPIGRPLSNTTVHLLDANLRPVPPGMAAELYIGGDGVARGYAGRPDLTAASFIPDPFSTRPGARMYNSGDWARYRHDGSIEFLGRRDQQVKLRGFRIELGEIEAAMLACDGVHGAKVVVRDTPPNGKRLLAYVERTAGADVSTARLRQQLGQRLPDYMVPSAFGVLDRFPLNANGKVDLKALLTLDDLATEVPVQAPSERSALQYAVTRIWQRMLELPQIGPDDNFFDLGGHSMLAIQLRTALNKELGFDIPIVDLFTHTTIRTLTAHLAQTRKSVPVKSNMPSRAQRANQYLTERKRVKRPVQP